MISARLASRTKKTRLRFEPSGASATSRRGGAGLILLKGSPLMVAYTNPDAAEILSEDMGDIPARSLIIEWAAQAIAADPSSHRHGKLTQLVLGNSPFLFRIFLMSPTSGRTADGPESDQPVAAVLLERTDFGVDVLRASRRFGLTAREQETLYFLTMGLTNKEIARRMRVSPNTIKAFLRTMLIKTGASTRSGIVGKCMQTAGDKPIVRALAAGAQSPSRDSC